MLFRYAVARRVHIEHYVTSSVTSSLAIDTSLFSLFLPPHARTINQTSQGLVGLPIERRANRKRERERERFSDGEHTQRDTRKYQTGVWVIYIPGKLMISPVSHERLIQLQQWCYYLFILFVSMSFDSFDFRETNAYFPFFFIQSIPYDNFNWQENNKRHN